MYAFSKRIFDVISSLLVLVVLLPFLLFIAIWISLESPGGPFYGQERIGKNGLPFQLFKFRSMRKDSDKAGLITIGQDPRITKSGAFLRKTKLDELPQLLNIIAGDMSVVGPRPEVRKYVDMYSDEQKKVLTVRPGLTDIASLEYINEQEILGKAEDPNQVYIQEVMPAKLKLNLEYIEKRGFWFDLGLVFKTIARIIT